MKQQSELAGRIVLRLMRLVPPVVVVFVLLVSWSTSDSIAQSVDRLRVSRVDTSAFPTVVIKVALPNALRASDEAIEATDFLVLENNHPISSTAVSLVQQDTQTGLIIDIDSADEQSLEKAVAAIDYITEENGSPAQHRANGWLSVLSRGTGGLDTIRWTTDHGAIRRSVSLPPSSPDENVSLDALIEAMLRSVETPESSEEIPEGLPKSIILFSGNTSDLNETEVRTLAARAQDTGVKIHLANVADDEFSAALRLLAVLTGGKIIEYDASQDFLTEIDLLYQSIATENTQLSIEYRSKVNSSGLNALSVSYLDPQGRIIDRTETTYAITLLPPSVEILQPPDGTVITRTSYSPGTPFDDLQPTNSVILIAWQFPDGHPRNVVTVDYEIDGVAFIRDSAPFDVFFWDISGTVPGPHVLRARVRDSLGLVGESRTTNVVIKISDAATPTRDALPVEPSPVTTPAAPTSTLTQTPASTPTPTSTTESPWLNTPSWITLISLAFAISALAFAIFVWFRRPAVRVMATQAVTGTIKAVTQPFTLDRRMKGPQAAKARLVLVEGDASLPPSVEIVGTNTRIGRDPSLANVVLDDPRVSRYHCRIAEEGDGTFRVYDEGSTSGTYVNYKPVDIRGQVLQQGDQVHIGPIGMRFDTSRPGERTDAMEGATEPYVPRFDAQLDDPFRTEPFRLQTPERKDDQQP